jgi:hypothetical protein
MSDHMLWAEAQDQAVAGSSQTAYVFFGHPSMSATIYLCTSNRICLSPNTQGREAETWLKKRELAARIWTYGIPILGYEALLAW